MLQQDAHRADKGGYRTFTSKINASFRAHHVPILPYTTIYGHISSSSCYEQVPKKGIAAQLGLAGLDPKTVRRYLSAAEAAGRRASVETLSDEQVRDVLLALQPSGGRPHGQD
jgi:hypothetical protein